MFEASTGRIFRWSGCVGINGKLLFVFPNVLKRNQNFGLIFKKKKGKLNQQIYCTGFFKVTFLFTKWRLLKPQMKVTYGSKQCDFEEPGSKSLILPLPARNHPKSAKLHPKIHPKIQATSQTFVVSGGL